MYTEGPFWKQRLTQTNMRLLSLLKKTYLILPFTSFITEILVCSIRGYHLVSHGAFLLPMVHKQYFPCQIEKILNPETHLFPKVSNKWLLTSILILKMFKEKKELQWKYPKFSIGVLKIQVFNMIFFQFLLNNSC